MSGWEAGWVAASAKNNANAAKLKLKLKLKLGFVKRQIVKILLSLICVNRNNFVLFEYVGASKYPHAVELTKLKNKSEIYISNTSTFFWTPSMYGLFSLQQLHD